MIPEPTRERSMTVSGMPVASTPESDAPQRRELGELEQMADKMDRLKQAARRAREEAGEAPAQPAVAPTAPEPAPVAAPHADPRAPLLPMDPGEAQAAAGEKTGRIPAVRVSAPEPGVAMPKSSLAAEERATIAEPASTPAPSRSAGLFGEIEDHDDDDGLGDTELSPPSQPKSKASSFEDGFLGDMDDDDDDDDDMMDGDFEGAVAQQRSLPLVPIGLGLAVVAGIGLFMFRAELFGGDAKDGDEQAVAAGDGSDEAEAKEDEQPADDKPETASEAAAPGTEGAPDASPTEATPTEAPPTEATPPAGEQPGTTPPAGTAPPGTAPPTTPAPPAVPPAAAEGFESALATARGAYKKRKLAKAMESVEAALTVAPNHPDGLVLKAQIQLEQSDQSGALATANACVGVDATKADCWLTIAVLQQNAKNIEPAIKAWEQYLAHAPPDARYISSAKSELKRLKKKLG
jgi:hypothetical protein